MCLCEPLGETMLTGEFYSDSNPVTDNMNLLQRPGPVHHIYVLYMRHFFSSHGTDTAPHPPFLLVTLRMSKVRVSRPQLLAVS